MLRVGLTGELGSGKSTVARLLAAHGAHVFSSDEMARAMMQPGCPVYRAIADRFGPGVLFPDGRLNRPELARLAFDAANPRVEELNAIVHPAVFAEQERRLAEIRQTQPDALVVIESALILSSRHTGDGAPWRKRFDRLVIVTAPDVLKVERAVRRSPGFEDLTPEVREALRRDMRARLQAQKTTVLPKDAIVIENAGDLHALQQQTLAVLHQLQAASSSIARNGA